MVYFIYYYLLQSIWDRNVFFAPRRQNISIPPQDIYHKRYPCCTHTTQMYIIHIRYNEVVFNLSGRNVIFPQYFEYEIYQKHSWHENLPSTNEPPRVSYYYSHHCYRYLFVFLSGEKILFLTYLPSARTNV